MKNYKNTRFIVVVLVLILASVSWAQNGLNIGGMIGSDHKRLEITPSVSFSLAVYDQAPPTRGFDGSGLIGLFSSSLGQYPAITAGLWVKAQIDPFGIDTLKGISRATVFNPSLKKDEDWEPIIREADGRYTDVRQLKEVGVVPLVYRLEHRDGRDRYQLLFITATWTKGGNLPAKLEIMVRRSAGRVDDMMQYLNGFVPASGPLHVQANPQNITVPGQTVNETVSSPPIGNEIDLPVIVPPTERIVSHIPPFGVGVSAMQYDLGSETRREDASPVDEPPTKSSKITDTTLSLGQQAGTILFFESKEEFTGEITSLAQNKTRELTVTRNNQGLYVASFYGETERFYELDITIAVHQDGQTRKFKFARRSN